MKKLLKIYKKSHIIKIAISLIIVTGILIFINLNKHPRISAFEGFVPPNGALPENAVNNINSMISSKKYTVVAYTNLYNFLYDQRNVCNNNEGGVACWYYFSVINGNAKACNQMPATTPFDYPGKYGTSKYILYHKSSCELNVQIYETINNQSDDYFLCKNIDQVYRDTCDEYVYWKRAQRGF